MIQIVKICPVYLFLKIEKKSNISVNGILKNAKPKKGKFN